MNETGKETLVNCLILGEETKKKCRRSLQPPGNRHREAVAFMPRVYVGKKMIE